MARKSKKELWEHEAKARKYRWEFMRQNKEYIDAFNAYEKQNNQEALEKLSQQILDKFMTYPICPKLSSDQLIKLRDIAHENPYSSVGLPVSATDYLGQSLLWDAAFKEDANEYSPGQA
ncbi:MAG: hypothetical protein KAI72_00965, partial [Candidatus Pacebacteria bacterium]|nr:hypothetical protein [Candidatus Paceibacterota bacterium]